MKKIEAIIKPFKLDEVKEALSKGGLAGMTISEVRGFGRTGSQSEVYRGSSYAVDFVPKLKLDLVVKEAMVTDVVEAILTTAKTGKIGDGKIFVTALEEVIRIRTDERGDDAL